MTLPNHVWKRDDIQYSFGSLAYQTNRVWNFPTSSLHNLTNRWQHWGDLYLQESNHITYSKLYSDVLFTCWCPRLRDIKINDHFSKVVEYFSDILRNTRTHKQTITLKGRSIQLINLKFISTLISNRFYPKSNILFVLLQNGSTDFYEFFIVYFYNVSLERVKTLGKSNILITLTIPIFDKSFQKL